MGSVGTPRPTPRHIVEDQDNDRVWYGPKITMGFHPAELEDGGCPYHPRVRSRDNWGDWLLGTLFDGCGCVTRFQITFEWWWGHHNWWTCAELHCIAQLHPRFVPARDDRPHQHGGKG